MILCVVNNDFRYELEKLCRIYLPFEKIETVGEKRSGGCCAVAEIKQTDGGVDIFASLSLDGKYSEHRQTVPAESDSADTERELATQLLYCFRDVTGYMPPWGILTGVRPAKLYSRLCAAEGETQADRRFIQDFLVSPDKLALCKATHKSEERIISLSAPESFSLYIAVPFCPSRCSYCSFVSHSVEHAKKLIPQYVDLLCEEIKLTAQIAKRNNLRLSTVYMGGGTPTTLTAEQLSLVLGTVRDNFDMSTARELTVEAGRPDTVTAEKLKAIKDAGTTRISINPQTMNDAVLAAIGRRHTARQTIDAFYLAREYGFDNINMDLIAGLPSDTAESFYATLDRIMELGPESVTVHSLSMKRASYLAAGGALPDLSLGSEAAKMVEHAVSRLSAEGILPYYMYRQSKTVGNLENVGFSKAGCECLYNVYIMDETHTILACGASGVTKLKEPRGPYIERIFNYKYPYEYIARFDELVKRKERVDAFYDAYR